jgi:hypothetical protein
MKTPQYSIEALRAYLNQRLIATFEQIRQKLGKPARATVFRLFDKAEVLSSYSHRGQYYTLRSIPQFGSQGLWEYDAVRFSRFGNLLQTLKALVERGQCGCSAQESQEQLGVETKHALVQLVRRKQVQRIRLGGTYVYFSADSVQSRQQQKARGQQQAELSAVMLGPKARLAVDEAKAALLLFWATLNERQRRLYAGLESAKLGHGGDQYVAGLFGIERHTVARGREELLRSEQDAGRIRQAGAGRPAVEKKRPKS